MKNIFNKEIDQLLLSVDFVERKFKKYYMVLANIKNKEESYILARNVFYFNLITEKINNNLKEIEINKKLIKNKRLKKAIKAKLKRNTKDKAIVCTILLKQLVSLVKNYSMDKYDFEVQAFVGEKVVIISEDIPTKYKDLVLDEFEEINKNFNTSLEKFVNIEGFFKKAIDWFKKAYNKVKNFANNVINKIGSFFKNFFNGLKNMLKIIKNIGVFLFKNLVNFIKLLWKLLKGLMYFVMKWVPRFVKRFFSFWSLLYNKSKKTGLITVGLYFMMNIGLTKYWDLLLEGQPVPPMVIEYPALFFTTYIFWTQTRALNKSQVQITNFIVKNLNVVNFFFTTILGLPPTNLFSSRMPFKRRLTLFARYMKVNLTKFVFRLLIFLFIFKIFISFGGNEFMEEGVPDFRDILVFPFIILRYLIGKIF